MERIIAKEFPKEVSEQAVTASKIRTSSYLAKRLDLRSKMIFSFSESANSPAEFAVSLYRNGNGWKLGVHVADVAEYACEGSPLDEEAMLRSARIYEGTSVREMLPPIIVNDLCNLAKNGDKLATSVFLSINEDGSLDSVEFDETVIRVSSNCIYSELDQLGLAADASAIMELRNKYSHFLDTLIDMYELAAVFCTKRRERGGLDCTYFRRVYGRDSEGKIKTFKRVPEPDSRAMVREIGYFVAEAVGRFMQEHKIPCIFNGRGDAETKVLNYLANLVGADAEEPDRAKLAADIADLAKGRSYYDFVCDALKHAVPCAEFSTKPIRNSFCGCDTIVPFFNPVSRYTGLLSQRTIKKLVRAKGNISNIDVNRYRKSLEEIAVTANASEAFADNAARRFSKLNALEFIRNNSDDEFNGIAVSKNEDGVSVILECGCRALIPNEHCVDYRFAPVIIEKFKILKAGDENELVLVKPQ